jgi:hypothetical protein
MLAFSPRDVAVVSVVTHHLLAPVRDMRTHRGQPFQRREALGCLAVLGSKLAELPRQCVSCRGK